MNQVRPADNSAEFHAEADDVFARIAGRYDLLCDIFSLLIHRLWKDRMARQLARELGSDLLDLCAGTGDIPQRALRRIGERPGLQIAVSDLCPQMLDMARRKLGETDPRVSFPQLDACALAGIPDAAYDVVSMAFGMKIVDRPRAMAEAFRVLRPGGVFLCLEASRIRPEWLHRLYLGYMDACMPLIGRIATGGDRSAYLYLLRGIHDFPDAEGLAGELAGHGFEEVTIERLSLGITALHRAVKPA